MQGAERLSTNELDDVTAMLRRWSAGDTSAAQAVLPRLYTELRQIAGAYRRRERPDHTLQPTALVHEAYLSLFGARGIEFRDRGHFLAVAARVMRRILVDHSRRHDAEKRGGDRRRVTLEDRGAGVPHSPDEVLAIHQALDRLAKHDPTDASIVEMRYFAGLSREEIAESLACSTKTISRRWRRARAWLLGELSGEPAHGR